MGARLSLAGELPPGAGVAVVGVGDGCHEGVQQAGVVAAAVERAQALEQLLAVLAREVGRLLDAQPSQLAGDGRPDVGDAREIAHTGPMIAGRGAGVLSKTVSAAARP